MGGGELLKKGWLIKSPPLDSGRIKNWRKRWFCLLSSKVLEYHKSEDGDVKGVINLEDCKAVNSGLAHKKYKCVFDVETRDRTYYLVASSQEEMKNWVDAICKVCAFSAFQVPTISARTFPLSSGSIPTSAGSSSSSSSNPFQPSENGASQDQLYSLATSAGSEVQRQLKGGGGGEDVVPAGVPLSEALASKGLAGSGRRSGSMSKAESSSSVSSATTVLPRPADSPYGVYSQAIQPPFDPSSLYSVSTKAKSRIVDPNSPYASPRECLPPPPQLGAATLEPSALYSSQQGALPVAKLRAATLNPAAMTYDYPRGGQLDQRSMPPSGSSQFSASLGGGTNLPFSPPLNGSPFPPPASGSPQTPRGSGGGGGGGAELMENNYMSPRIPPNKRVNYDYPPFGPPREADFPGQGEISTSSPRGHRSALLRNDSSPSVGPEQQQQQQPEWGVSPSDAETRTYINMQELREELPAVTPRVPPPIDRSTKPPEPSPPKVKRDLKPSLSGVALSAGPASDSSSEEEPPPPDFPRRHQSLGGVLSEEIPFDSDLPTPTSRSTKYTQIQFDPASQKLVMSPQDGLDTRRPIPAPRTSGPKTPGQPVPAKRVNYSDVDLAATEELALKRQVTLMEADEDYLAGRPYVNVKRSQEVDEETDPEYYTHMRNFVFDRTEEPYCTMHRHDHDNIDKYNEEGQELYEEPPRPDEGLAN